MGMANWVPPSLAWVCMYMCIYVQPVLHVHHARSCTTWLAMDDGKCIGSGAVFIQIIVSTENTRFFLATVNVHKMLLVSFHNNIGQLWLHFDFFLCYKLQTSQLYKFQWSDVHKWITNIAILASCIGTGFSPNKGQNYCAFQYWRAKEREPLAVWWTTPHFSSSLTCWLIVTSDPCLRCQCTAALFMPPPHSVQPHSHPLSHPVKARLNLKASPEVRLPGHLKHPNPGPRVPTLVPKPPGAQKGFVLPTTIPGCSRTCLQASATFSLGQTMIHASIGTWCTGLALEQHLDDGFWDLQPWMAQRPPP